MIADNSDLHRPAQPLMPSTLKSAKGPTVKHDGGQSAKPFRHHAQLLDPDLQVGYEWCALRAKLCSCLSSRQKLLFLCCQLHMMSKHAEQAYMLTLPPLQTKPTSHLFAVGTFVHLTSAFIECHVCRPLLQ